MVRATNSAPQSFGAQAESYVNDVLDGIAIASKWIRLACQRHLKDLERALSDDYIFTFDAEKAERACRFISLLRHTKGRWRGQLIQLRPWQCWLVCMLFGWVEKETGLRRFRKALILIARKNAKSTLAAAIALYMLVADREPGAEVYSGATSERQAWEVFGTARQMVMLAPDLCRQFGVQVNASNIAVEATASKFEPIIGRPGDGSSPSCAIHDEYHEHPTDAQVDTMATGMGARQQPLQILITTAGDNLAGPCYAAQRDAQKVLEGAIENERLFAAIYCADLEDDWDSEAALLKANPNIDVSVSREFLEQQRAEALSIVRKQGVFKTKHLNLWVNAMAGYFDTPGWIQLAQPELRIETHYGKDAYAGLDLASKIDVAALELVIPYGERVARFGRYYLPQARLNEPGNEHYRSWALEGRLIVTDGEIIDFERIRDDILELCTLFRIKAVAYDPFQATMLVTQLMNNNVPVIQYGATVQNFSEPMKTMDSYIRDGRYDHDGDPVMTWMISNVVAREDRKENVYPNKDAPEKKIDGVVAHLMAFGAYLKDLRTQPSVLSPDQIFRMV